MAAVAGKLGSGAMNANVENVFVTGNINGGLCTGAFAGAVEGTSTMKNVFAQADITSDSEVAAGLVGYVNADLTLENAYYAGNCDKAIIASVESGKNADIKNVVNWTRNADSNAQYNFDGTNHAELQKTGDAFDADVWGCTMKEGDYPVLKAFGEVVPDAIQTLTSDSRTIIFDLSGRQVRKAQKGMYIMNGTKVIVK